MHLDGHVLEVQQDFDYILLHPFNGAVLVQNAFDLSFHDGTAGHGRKQDATQSIPQGVAETTLEGFEDDSRVMGADFLDLDIARTEKLCH
ncbi:hypothetical protein CLAM6_33290 [Cobetia sp. AM6]|nr:hypothetical protein CLAM6_33290 [Cobetia sp. AM6]